MSLKPRQVSGCWFGRKFFASKAWRRLRRDAKRATARKRRRLEKKRGPEDSPDRATKGWAD